MHVLWEDFRLAVPLIVHGDPYLMQTIGFTLQVAVIATLLSSLLGVPAGVALGLGRFRGRGALVLLANAGLALPPVLVGLFLFLLFLPGSALGGLHLLATRRAVFIAQTILALPFVIALTTAAVNGLPQSVLGQARALRCRARSPLHACTAGSSDRRDRGDPRRARDDVVRGRRGGGRRRERLRL